MGLKEIQKSFVELAVDPISRTKAFSGLEKKDSTYAEFNEKEILEQANALVNKRLGVTKKILPFTRYHLGKDFDMHFRSFAKGEFEPKGVHRHKIDAIKFSKHLKALTIKRVIPRFIIDISAFEVTPIKMWTMKKKFLFQFHLYNPRKFMRKQKSKFIIPIPTVMLWREATGKKRGYFWREFSLWI
jgi:hypothetical protein